MCRIFGISYGGPKEDIDAGQISALMFRALTPGGPHAFGWMNWIDGADKITYESHPGRVDTLDNLEYVYSAVAQEPRWMVGHTRYATHGDPKNNINNHPILHGNLLGVHNGILKNHEAILAETGRQNSEAIVDSEAIFAAVNRWGAMPGIRKIDGDMVAVWADLHDLSTLYIARSEGRFLHLAWTDRGNLIFASDPKAIEVLHPLVRIVKWSQVDQQKLLTIKDGKIINRQKIREPRPKVVTKVLGKDGKPTGEFFSASGVAAQKRGSRRGEAMFGTKPKTDHSQALWDAEPVTKPRKPKTKKSKVEGKVVSERWIPELGMFADDDDNLRPATDAEAAFFGWDDAKNENPYGWKQTWDEWENDNSAY